MKTSIKTTKKSDCFRWCRKKEKKDTDHIWISYKNEYTEGESDTEFEIPFSTLKKEDKHMRVKYMWH